MPSAPEQFTSCSAESRKAVTEQELFRVWEFKGQDEAYRQWLESHPEGFVINTNRDHSPGYMVLHRAKCRHISNFQARTPGAFTERDFVKVCAIHAEHLQEWVKLHGRPDGTFSSACGICLPQSGAQPTQPSKVSAAPIPGLTAQESAKLLEECRKLPPAQGNYLINDYVENVLLTVLDFQMQTPTVEKAAQHYLKYIRADIRTHQDLQQLLARFPDTQEGNTQIAQYLWGYKLWTRVALLRCFLNYLEAQGATDQAQLKAWAACTTYAQFAGQVKGMGLGIFQWLVMRQGVETIKPDIWVHRFLKESIGRGIDDFIAVAALEEAAKKLNLKAYELDWRIWESQRAKAIQ